MGVNIGGNAMDLEDGMEYLQRTETEEERNHMDMFECEEVMANIYTLDGELQQFEKSVYLRNPDPDQSAYDPCFVAKECQYHVTPIMKTTNPLLKSRFPEADEFFNIYSIGTTQINLLVSKYLNTATDSLTTTEKWLNASCDWLKNNASESIRNTASWNIDIDRMNVHPVVVLMHMGECECAYDEIFADTSCTCSCPCLIGPYTNSSGHGICDTDFKQTTTDKSDYCDHNSDVEELYTNNSQDIHINSDANSYIELDQNQLKLNLIKAEMENGE